MKTIKRYIHEIHENGRSRKANCIIPFCRKKFASKLELFVCKFNVTPAKYSPIYYCGSIGEALVDFHTLKRYRYKEPVEIVSMEMIASSIPVGEDKESGVTGVNQNRGEWGNLWK